MWLWVGIGCGASLALKVLRGWRLSGVGLRGLLELARAASFLASKLILMLRRRDSRMWVRT